MKVFTSFAAAMKDYFGYLPGQDMRGFMEELRALTPEDRAYFRDGLKSVGYQINA